jgi:PKD repeat protein
MKRLLLVVAVIGLGACVLDKQDPPPLAGPSVPQQPTGAPVAGFAFAPSVAVKSEPVLFDGSLSSDDGPIVDFVWTFSDGGLATGEKVTRSFPTPGVFTVVLRVTDADGQTSAAMGQVTVRDSAVVADFSISPTDPVVGAVVNFNGALSSTLPGATIVQYDWDFGDGTSATGIQANHTFDLAQTFTIVLTVRDSAGRVATASKTLQVK